MKGSAVAGWSGEDPSLQAQNYLKSAFTVINAADSSQVCLNTVSFILSPSGALMMLQIRVAQL